MHSKALFLTLALGGAFVGGVTYSALNTTKIDGSAATPYAADADAGSCPMSSGGCGDKSGGGDIFAAAPSADQLAAFDALLDGTPATPVAAETATAPAADQSFAAQHAATITRSTPMNAPATDGCPAIPGCCAGE